MEFDLVALVLGFIEVFDEVWGLGFERGFLVVRVRDVPSVEVEGDPRRGLARADVFHVEFFGLDVDLVNNTTPPLWVIVGPEGIDFEVDEVTRVGEL